MSVGPQIIRCVSERVSVEEFFGHSRGEKKKVAARPGATAEDTRSAYYVQLARSRFGLMVPGMGYDCFRNWEMLLMGSLGVIERGIGFDRTVIDQFVWLLCCYDVQAVSNAASSCLLAVLAPACAAGGRLRRHL